MLKSGSGPTLRARFEREQRLLAQLSHPSVAQVYDAGATEDGLLYVAVELLEGDSITAHANAHGLSTRERIELLIAVCHAVRDIHSCGILHRDLKPSNILIGDRHGKPVPKVIDFGASMVVDGDFAMDSIGPEMVGTIAYMAPEQLAGGDRGSIQTDIFALGVIGHELVGGAHPFGGASVSVGELVRAVEQAPLPSLARTGSGRRNDLDAVLAKACEKDPSKRYQSVGHLADDLARVLDGLPVEAKAPTIVAHVRSAARRHPIVSLASGFGIAALAALGVLLASSAYRNAVLVREARADVEQLVDDVLVELDEMNGSTEVRRRLAMALLTRLADVAAIENDAELLALRGRVLTSLGGLEMEVRHHDAAIAFRREALELFQRAADLTPAGEGRLQAESDVDLATIRLGDALDRAKRYDEASEQYMIVHERLLAAFEADRSDQRVLGRLSWSFERLTPFALRRSSEEAHDLCVQRLRFARRQFELDPESTNARFNLVCAESWMSEAMLWIGKPLRAIEHAERAEELLSLLIAEHPDRFAYRARAVINIRRLGRAMLEADDPRLWETVERALAAARQFQADNPNSATAESFLKSHDNLLRRAAQHIHGPEGPDSAHPTGPSVDHIETPDALVPTARAR